jgi:branched-chain amino acid transport system ATP-binding protein
MNNIILQTHNLTKHFDGVYAVNDLSIAFKQGAITGIIGPNGSGKSTLINLLSGIYKFNKGTVLIDGIPTRNINTYEISAFGITRTFQEIRLFEQMTVLDNILVALTSRHVFSSLFEKHTELHLRQTREILEKIGLEEKKDQLAHNLSYGQRKLLEIGRVLAMSAEIILLDEPFSGLFAEMAKVIVKILRELKQQGKTLVLIEHNMELIRQLADYLYVMDEGRLLAHGEPARVLAERKVIEAYLGE